MAQLDIQLPPIFQHPHIRHTQKKHTHYRGLPTSMALSSIKSLLKRRNPSRSSSNISQATTTLHPDSSEPTFPPTNPTQPQPPSWSRSNPNQLPSPAERAASIWAADAAIRSHIRARWPDHHQDLIRIDCFSFRQGGGPVTTGSDIDDEENDDDDEPGLTMSRLRRLGTLPRDEGIRACMRVVRAPVIQEEVARRLWEWIVEGGLEDEFDKKGEGEKAVTRTAGVASSSSRSSRRSNGVDEESDVDDQLSVVTSVASTNADLKKVNACDRPTTSRRRPLGAGTQGPEVHNPAARSQQSPTAGLAYELTSE
ncbi:hypothetical protein VTJ04DRAFT_6645 [Mycothermus thermophilus]|uniref:uncharacterized protein n=1 Tax=Humicola insolens TaxID=85995 RepID=UPI0037428291